MADIPKDQRESFLKWQKSKQYQLTEQTPIWLRPLKMPTTTYAFSTNSPDYREWVAAGMPEAYGIAGLTPKTQAIRGTPEYLAAEARQQEMAAGGWTAADLPDLPTPPTPAPLLKSTEPLTYEQALAIQQLLGTDYYIEWDAEVGGYTVTRGRLLPELPSALQQEQLKISQEQLELTKAAENRRLLEMIGGKRWEMATEAARKAEAEADEAYRRAVLEQNERQHAEMLAWNREQEAGRLAAEKEQRLATLRANPTSWLEYASLAGQQPAIQPWMLPLMPQQYAGTVAGAPIPGWSAGAPTMAELPELTTPSRQYQARMGPTGVAQYQGYQQARTGMLPSETEWRLWSQAPPGGTNTRLRWQR